MCMAPCFSKEMDSYILCKHGDLVLTCVKLRVQGSIQDISKAYTIFLRDGNLDRLTGTQVLESPRDEHPCMFLPETHAHFVFLMIKKIK
jgi:hypothetical protein